MKAIATTNGSTQLVPLGAGVSAPQRQNHQAANHKRQLSACTEDDLDENHSCQDEELVINTLVTEPDLQNLPLPDLALL